jgi:hypothetical protein
MRSRGGLAAGRKGARGGDHRYDEERNSTARCLDMPTGRFACSSHTRIPDRDGM